MKKIPPWIAKFYVNTERSILIWLSNKVDTTPPYTPKLWVKLEFLIVNLQFQAFSLATGPFPKLRMELNEESSIKMSEFS